MFFVFCRVYRVISETRPSRTSLADLYRVAPVQCIKPYLVSFSTRLVSRRLQLGRVVSDSADFLNPDGIL